MTELAKQLPFKDCYVSLKSSVKHFSWNKLIDIEYYHHHLFQQILFHCGVHNVEKTYLNLNFGRTNFIVTHFGHFPQSNIPSFITPMENEYIPQLYYTLLKM